MKSAATSSTKKSLPVKKIASTVFFARFGESANYEHKD